jgi:hypothetical protein
MRLSGVETLPKQTACQWSLQSFSEGTRQGNIMTLFFDLLVIVAVIVCWQYIFVVLWWIKKLFS